MSGLLARYAAVAGEDVIEQLRGLARPLAGLRVVHVNSTRVGGGVAEILVKLVPFLAELGLRATWEVIEGDERFYACTKLFHNALQGFPLTPTAAQLAVYERTNRDNAESLRPALRDADVVVIHDPQPAYLRECVPERRGRWVWRCHIDLSHPHRPVWRYLLPRVAGFDASIFSLPDFVQRLPHPCYLIPPSIDPLSAKNIELEPAEIAAVRERFGLDPARYLVTQVSRFDRFKDPLGVVRAYRLAKLHVPGLQLVLAGGEAADDPEGAEVLREVQTAVGDDPDVRILLLPADAHRTINALQRASDLILQKSTREGFGLTVTEGLWKGKPVIGGNVGGIRLQVHDHQTGFLVDTPEGAALRIRYLLSHPRIRERMGERARAFVQEHYLLTRHLVEYLALFHCLLKGRAQRIEVG
ncbi:MAG TPA: glycosyltransferase [Candidatus Krumholzibacteria bacterium]|nr:glycosyltransferase [Candidatus Krumholzibacteria bacterium]HPD70975.1 glycosyltransferase [Candidatus Krumholzibacteria bacterium]HRY39325.1 glycosyltransferase [Candidatus Krumholzibacteria bacterium]